MRGRSRIVHFCRPLTVGAGAVIAIATAMVLSMTVTLLQQVPALAEPGQGRPAPQQEPSVPGREATYSPPRDNPVAKAAVRGPRQVVWPTASSAEVDVAAVASARSADPGAPRRARAGSLPVWVGPSNRATSERAERAEVARPGRVRVEVLDRASAEKAGQQGVLLRVGRTDAVSGTGWVSLEVDYSGFRHAYGGDWATRLRLVRLPDCALTRSDEPECASAPVPTRNNGSGRLSADVTASSTTTMYALSAGASGSSGDFTATPLAASATWSAGGSSGDFSWSYPLRVPPSPGGPGPQIALSYSSGSVDRRGLRVRAGLHRAPVQELPPRSERVEHP
jgi:hypothetical protein